MIDLAQIKQKTLAGRKKVTVRCCMAAGCMSAQAQQAREALQKAVAAHGLEDQVEIRRVGCMRLCSQGPLVQADPTRDLYQKVKPEQAASIIEALQGGQSGCEKGDPDSPFFKLQTSLVLANNGVIDPERIEDYIAADGYAALHEAIHERTPKDIVDAVVKSGLRGRGGAGFPTGVKWGTVAKAAGNRKHVICNGDEGDPGAFMDRSVLEGDPHSVLEGMAIAGYAVGAEQGYIYVRAEYPLAIARLKIAIRQAKELGVIGSGIFDSRFNFNIDLRIGAGAFVCGEETALMASVEGERGTPRPRPPFPAESGLWGTPTLINNVETLAAIPAICRRGPEWFAAIGTEKSKGTKVFSLTGKVKNAGLIEVPMGTTVRTIVEEIGGGAVDGGEIKAVQTGGPSGGCVPREHLDTPVEYESLVKLGTILGSGGMIVMDQSTDMVDVARFFVEFCMEESCGKCIPCRAGTAQIHTLLEKILARKATQRDLNKLEELCEMVKSTGLCGLGQTAPNPVLSTLRFFRDEYLQRLQPDRYGPHRNGASVEPAGTSN